MRGLCVRAIMFVIMCVSVTSSVSAHTMWLSIAENDKDVSKQTATVYFGEFGDEKATPYARWFSNLKDVAVYVQNPKGEVIQLTNGLPLEDGLSFDFATELDGLYKVYFEHEVKDVFKGMKITYSSVALYAKNYSKDATVGFYGLDLKWKKVGDKLAVLTKNGAAMKDFNVTAVKKGSKEGELTLQSDKKGKIAFEKTVSGVYLMEVVAKEDVPETLHNDKPFTVDFKMYTYQVKF